MSGGGCGGVRLRSPRLTARPDVVRRPPAKRALAVRDTLTAVPSFMALALVGFPRPPD